MRFGRFKEAATEMVNDMYEAESRAEYEESNYTTISVKVSVPTAALLNVLAERFQQSRYAFSGGVLEDFASDLLLSLRPEDQEKIAKKADEATTELLFKQGITVESHGPAGSIKGDQTWRMWLAAGKYFDEKDKQQGEAA